MIGFYKTKYFKEALIIIQKTQKLEDILNKNNG